MANKAKAACERNRIMVGVNKRGNLVITFNAGAFRHYHRILDHLFEEVQEQDTTIQLNIDRTNGKDNNGVITDTTYKIKNPRGEGCVINCYHTTYRALVNGSVTYYRNDINPLIVQRMSDDEISEQNIEIMNDISNNHQSHQEHTMSQQDLQGHTLRQQVVQNNQHNRQVDSGK